MGCHLCVHVRVRQEFDSEQPDAEYRWSERDQKGASYIREQRAVRGRLR